MLNSVNLIGRLGQDPESRSTGSGTNVCTLSVATSRKDKQGQDVTQWHKVTCFGKTADNVVRYLSKGALVHIQGEIQYSNWTDREGVKRYGVSIVAFRILFLETSRNQANRQQNHHEQQKSNGYQPPSQQVSQRDPQHWQGGQQQQQHQEPSYDQEGPYGPPPSFDDDVPF